MINKKEKKTAMQSQAVFRTKIWKEIVACCLLSAVLCIVFMVVLNYAAHKYINEHIAGSEELENESQQLIAELQAYVSQKNLGIENTKEIRQWEMKKNAEIRFYGTKETMAELYDFQKKYNNTIIRILNTQDELPKHTYEVRFKDTTVICSPVLKKVPHYYNVTFFVSAVVSMLLFVFILLQLVRRRIYYVIRLRDDLRRLESGDLEHQVTVTGKDELSEIGNGMNTMRRNILAKIKAERETITANHDLITAMSHDLRTPLTKQIGYLEILSRKKYTGEEELCDYIEKAKKNAFIMKDTTDKLFRYFLAFGEQEKTESKSVVDGKALLNAALREQIAYIISQGFVVSYEEITEKFRMSINPEEFARVFDNVFHNLKKYGDNTVPVYITHVMQKDEFLVMVQNGIKEDISHVESTKVGLKIVENIMKSMDGNMEVMNDGQYFIIQLIFRVEQEEDA